jgi:hypothetical protein
VKDHVVVTVYTGNETPIVRDGNRDAVIHTYGPYTKDQARNERRKMMIEYHNKVSAGTLLISACKIIDIDAMNAKLKEEKP